MMSGSIDPAEGDEDHMDESAIRRLYDRFSSVPWLWTVDTWVSRSTAGSPYRARVIERLGLKPTSTVLDVACGTGLNFDLLQRTVADRGRIVGIDYSGRTLGLARRRVARRGWTNVELVEVDAPRYRPAKRFDAALCTFAIDIIPDWRGTIAMMAGALRPGGRMGFLAFHASSRRWPYRLGNPLWRASASSSAGIDPGRPLRDEMNTVCDDIVAEDAFGGFYHLLVGVRRAAR
jgi:SAM-dependent methyltransferase